GKSGNERITIYWYCLSGRIKFKPGVYVNVGNCSKSASKCGNYGDTWISTYHSTIIVIDSVVKSCLWRSFQRRSDFTDFSFINRAGFTRDCIVDCVISFFVEGLTISKYFIKLSIYLIIL